MKRLKFRVDNNASIRQDLGQKESNQCWFPNLDCVTFKCHRRDSVPNLV